MMQLLGGGSNVNGKGDNGEKEEHGDRLLNDMDLEEDKILSDVVN